MFIWKLLTSKLKNNKNFENDFLYKFYENDNEQSDVNGKRLVI